MFQIIFNVIIKGKSFSLKILLKITGSIISLGSGPINPVEAIKPA